MEIIGATNADKNDRGPHTDSVMICARCGYPMMFKADPEGELYLDRLTAEQLIELIDDPRFLRARAMVAAYIDRQQE